MPHLKVILMPLSKNMSHQKKQILILFFVEDDAEVYHQLFPTNRQTN